MNRKTVLQLLRNPLLDQHERELLQQYLHYLQAEGIDQGRTKPQSGKPKQARSVQRKNSKR